MPRAAKAKAKAKAKPKAAPARGGRRPGAGRPKGARNKKTAAVIAAIEASGTTPLDFMLDVMRNPALPICDRFEAAKAAAPYVHPRLASLTNPKGDGPCVIEAITRTIVEAAESDSVH